MRRRWLGRDCIGIELSRSYGPESQQKPLLLRPERGADEFKTAIHDGLSAAPMNLKLALTSRDPRVGRVERELANLHVDFAGMHVGLDNVNHRLDRVERRLELVDESTSSS